MIRLWYYYRKMFKQIMHSRRRKVVVILVILLGLTMLVAGVLKATSQQPETSNQFYTRQLGTIKSSTESIMRLNSDENALSEKNIDEYEASLVNGIGSCRKLEAHYQKISSDSSVVKSKEAEDARTQVKQFCADYINVVDYARLLSKSTKQFVRFPSASLTVVNGQISQENVNSLREIIGYTMNDLEKLKSNKINDPAIQEYLANLVSLQKKVDDTTKDPNSSSSTTLSQITLTQQKNMLSSRYYYWNNTIRVDSLLRSVDKLSIQFK